MRQFLQSRTCSNRTGVTYYGLERALLYSCLHIALDDAAFVQRDELAKVSIALAEKRRQWEVAQDGARSLWQGYKIKKSALAMELADEAEQEAEYLLSEVKVLEKTRWPQRAKFFQKGT